MERRRKLETERKSCLLFSVLTYCSLYHQFLEPKAGAEGEWVLLRRLGSVLRLRAREPRGWLVDCVSLGHPSWVTEGDVEGVARPVQVRNGSQRTVGTRRRVLWQVFGSVSLETLARCVLEAQMQSSNDGIDRSMHVCESLEGCEDMGEHEAPPRSLTQNTQMTLT
jgi:hypothetical protein